MSSHHQHLIHSRHHTPAADLKCYRYNHVRKSFVEGAGSSIGDKAELRTMQLNGSAQQKRDLWVRRFDCLKQRTLRNPSFAPPVTTYNLPSQGNHQVRANISVELEWPLKSQTLHFRPLLLAFLSRNSP